MNRVDPASGIFVMAGDEAGVIAHISKVPAGAGVNVATISAAFMGSELAAILTGGCYDRAPYELNPDRLPGRERRCPRVAHTQRTLCPYGCNDGTATGARGIPVMGPKPWPHGDRMLRRRVLLTLKDPGGEIVGLCGDWGLTSKPSAVQELLTGVCRYYVAVDGERLDVRALQVEDGYLLTTSPDGLTANHLDQLPDG